MSLPQHREAEYHRNPYRREIEIWVDTLGEHPRFGQYLLFSDSIFHPHGGGQKGDRGLLHLGGEVAEALGCPSDLPLTDTRRENRDNLHVLGSALDNERAHQHLVGSRLFRLTLDWEFRYRQMRLHSAAHLLHCFVERVLGNSIPFPETSDLQPEYGLNRYETKGLLMEEQVREAEQQLNLFTAEGHAISTSADPEKEGFRYWHCEDWIIPCGGTHLRNTNEIGEVRVSLGLKRGRTSLTFTLTD
ncbi:MAG: alanyl-tRNA editing protein [SAR324 cluster bacterium]|nr:alanyl-tRNA editing protein [SAR324 cluster bacterium]